ncbi:MAG TPA: glycosyltransferase 87 family protein, partial [Bdellovibrionota bacterium]|nr:glycosyltransferase 87 family protein [Bdellovibrionota bacterium]
IDGLRKKLRLPAWLTPRTALLIFLPVYAAVAVAVDLGRSANQAVVPQDFEVVVRARDRIAAGMDPYVLTDDIPYKYSPFATLPYFLLPDSHAAGWMIYELLVMLGWVAVLGLGVPALDWRKAGLVALGAVLSWKGIRETLDFGQAEFLFLGIGVVAAWLFNRRPLEGALLIGILPWIKLPWGFVWIPFIAEAVLRKDHRRLPQLGLGLLVSSLACGVVLPALALGPTRAWELTVSWHRLVTSQPRALFETRWNQSIWQSLERWFGHDLGSSWPVRAIVVVLAAAAIRSLIRGMARRRPSGPLAWISPWFLLNQLLSPLGWSWGNLLVAGAPLASEDATLRKRSPALHWALVVMIAAGWIIQQKPVAPLFGLERWDDFFSFGSVTLFWLSLLLFVI